MAKETAAEKQVRVALERLPEIVKATQASETGYLFTDFLVYSPLENLGLVIINEEITNEAGEVATRATAKGVEKVMSEYGDVENVVEETVAVKPVFTIVNVPLPVYTRAGGVRGSKYPFDDLEVNQSFFVAATEKVKEPAKALASTVSAKTKAYDEAVFEEDGVTPKTRISNHPKTKGAVVPVTKHTRKFSIVACDGAAYGQPGVAGAAIGRIL